MEIHAFDLALLDNMATIKLKNAQNALLVVLNAKLLKFVLLVLMDSLKTVIFVLMINVINHVTHAVKAQLNVLHAVEVLS